MLKAIDFGTVYVQRTKPQISENSAFWIDDVCLGLGYPTFSGSGLSSDLTNENGKITTRMSKMWKAAGFDIKTPAVKAALERIGAIASKESSRAISMYTFTQRFEWDAGDFKDNRSCYWGSNRAAKNIIQDSKGFALLCFDVQRFLKDLNFQITDDNAIVNAKGEVLTQVKDIFGSRKGSYRYGAARAWVVPKLDEKVYAVFNAYGYELTQMAAILAHHLQSHKTETTDDWLYSRHQLTNRGSYRNTVYINNEGSGYVVSSIPHNVIPYPLDLELTEPICSCCGSNRNLTQYKGVNYCNSCFVDRFALCNVCEEYHPKSVLHSTANLNVCNTCIESGLENGTITHCTHCNTYIVLDLEVHLAQTETNAIYCSVCMDGFYTCSVCENVFNGLRETNILGGTVICDACLDTHIECCVCHSITDVGLFGNQIQHICESCVTNEI